MYGLHPSGSGAGNPQQSLRERVRISCAAVLSGLILILPYFPAHGFLVWVMDGGVFSYIGQQLLGGAILYRDVMDVKPPAIYLMNAAGLWLGRGDVRGIAALAGALISVFVAVFLYMTRGFSWFARLTAVASILLWLTKLSALNTVGCFSLIPHLIILWIAITEFEDNDPGRLMFPLGAATALLFFFRPNDILTGGLYALVAIFRMTASRRSGAILRFLGGAAIPTAVFLVPILHTGAWPDFLNAVTGYKFQYLQRTSPVMKLVYPLFAAEHLGETGLLGLGIGTAAWPLWQMLRGRVTAPPIVIGASLILVVEILAGSLSGLLYSHYISPALPACGVLTAWVLDRVFFRVADDHILNGLSRVICAAVCSVFVMSTLHLAWKVSKETTPDFTLSQKVVAATLPTDTVYFWAGERLSLPVLAGRRSPSRYFFLTVVFIRPSIFSRLMPELLSDLERREPRIIADCGGGEFPYLFDSSQDWLPRAKVDYPGWNAAGITAARARLGQQYRQMYTDRDTSCVVYQRMGPNPKL